MSSFPQLGNGEPANVAQLVRELSDRLCNRLPVQWAQVSTKRYRALVGNVEQGTWRLLVDTKLFHQFNQPDDQIIWPDNDAHQWGDDKPTGVEAEVCADIAQRQRKGVGKYGTTVAENPLSLKQWLQHSYEEALDLAVYLKRAMKELK